MKQTRLVSPASILLLTGVLGANPSPAHDYWKLPTHGKWVLQRSGTDASLRGVSVAPISTTLGRTPFPSPVVWVSGSKGTILRSMDQGETWQPVSPFNTKDLDFRGIVAFDEKTAYAMSSGEGDKSRIYRTSDGGRTWKLQLTDGRKEFFLDSIACASETRCIALGDPTDGKFTLLRTEDGEHWASLPREHVPDALPGEGSFAASNSCLLLKPGNPGFVLTNPGTTNETEFFFVTGGAKAEGKGARVFHTSNSGKSWDITEPPIAQGNAFSGIFAIAFDRGSDTLVVVGGDYKNPDQAKQIAAYSADDGKTWIAATIGPSGFRSAVAAITTDQWIAIGPNGTDVSSDGGKHWHSADQLPLNALALRYNSGWAVGPNGAIARLLPELELM